MKYCILNYFFSFKSEVIAVKNCSHSLQHVVNQTRLLTIDRRLLCMPNNYLVKLKKIRYRIYFLKKYIIFVKVKT